MNRNVLIGSGAALAIMLCVALFAGGTKSGESQTPASSAIATEAPVPYLAPVMESEVNKPEANSPENAKPEAAKKPVDKHTAPRSH